MNNKDQIHRRAVGLEHLRLLVYSLYITIVNKYLNLPDARNALKKNKKIQNISHDDHLSKDVCQIPIYFAQSAYALSDGDKTNSYKLLVFEI